MTAGEVRFGALCCVCGNFRPGVGGGRHTTMWPAPEDEANARQHLAAVEAELAAHPNRRAAAAAAAYWRQLLEHLYENTTCDLKCPICGNVTRHAVVRAPKAPDYYEQANRGRSARPIGSAEALTARGLELVEVANMDAAACWVREVRVVLVRAGMAADERERALSRIVSCVKDKDDD